MLLSLDEGSGSGTRQLLIAAAIFMKSNRLEFRQALGRPSASLASPKRPVQSTHRITRKTIPKISIASTSF